LQEEQKAAKVAKENRMNSSLPLLPSIPVPSARPIHDAIVHWVILILCSGILLSAALLTVGDSGVLVPILNRRLPELCTLRRLTGLDCPGCGLTRCFVSAAHGDIPAAWSFNPAGLWLFAIIAAQIPLRGYQLWRIAHGRREFTLIGIGQIAFAVFAVALVGQWLLRMAGFR
jgi:hypothetical protein